MKYCLSIHSSRLTPLTAAIRIRHVSAIKSVLKQRAGSSHATGTQSRARALSHPLFSQKYEADVFPLLQPREHQWMPARGLVRRGSCRSRRDLSQEQPWPIPPCQPGEEGRSVTLRKEIPPLQRGGFNPWFTETSMAYAMLSQRRVWKFPAQHQTIENLKQYLEPIHQMRSHSSFQFFSTARSLPLGRARKALAHGAQHQRGPKRAGLGAPTHHPHPSPPRTTWVPLCQLGGTGMPFPRGRG